MHLITGRKKKRIAKQGHFVPEQTKKRRWEISSALFEPATCQQGARNLEPTGQENLHFFGHGLAEEFDTTAGVESP